MQVDIIPIGNSKGVRIPKALLEQCGFKDHAEIVVERNQLVLRPKRAPREGWKQSFSRMAECGDDVLLDAHRTTAFDEGEWKW